jgi:hypothetical protein
LEKRSFHKVLFHFKSRAIQLFNTAVCCVKLVANQGGDEAVHSVHKFVQFSPDPSSNPSTTNPFWIPIGVLRDNSIDRFLGSAGGFGALTKSSPRRAETARGSLPFRQAAVKANG